MMQPEVVSMSVGSAAARDNIEVPVCLPEVMVISGSLLP